MIRPFRKKDAEGVVAIWRATGLLRPWNDPYQDISHKQAMDDGLFLVAEEDDSVVGTVMAGYDGHRGWIYYLTVDPGLRGNGIGKALMGEAEGRLAERGCPKVNLQIRTGNQDVIAFYRHLGYQVDDVVSVGKRLDA